jgi:hypothetical protein
MRYPICLEKQLWMSAFEIYVGLRGPNRRFVAMSKFCGMFSCKTKFYRQIWTEI